MDTLQQILDTQAQEFARLTAIEAEYKMTLRVLAVLAERLLAATSAERIEISDAALVDTPDIIAWRDAPSRTVVITVAR